MLPTYSFAEVINVYRRIRDLREDKDLTQAQIAKLLRCSQRIYSNYECGDVDIPTHILIELAGIHHTGIDYLLGLTNQKTPYEKNV